MKKIIFTLIIIMMLSGVVLAVPEWEAVRTDEAPTINAEFEEIWSKATVFELSQDIVDQGGTILVIDEKDVLSRAEIYLLWDQDNLYLYAKVEDQDPYFSKEYGEMLNSGTDAIQLCIEPINKRLDNNNLAFIFDLTADSADDSGALVWEHWQFGSNVDEIIIEGKVTDNGYEIEAAIPWDILNYEDYEITDVSQVEAIMNYDLKVEVGTEFPFGMTLLDASVQQAVHTLLFDFGDGEMVIGQPLHWNTLTLVE